MEPSDAHRLAARLRQARLSQGLSATQVAKRAGLTAGTVTRIELAQIANPRPESLIAIAAVLDIPTAELFAAADWLPARALPSFAPYMRMRYGRLPAQARQELYRFFTSIEQRYGSDGPAPGQDE